MDRLVNCLCTGISLPPSLCTCVNLWVKIIYLVILAINLSGICRISGKVFKYFNVAITAYLKVVGLINSK